MLLKSTGKTEGEEAKERGGILILKVKYIRYLKIERFKKNCRIIYVIL